MKIIKYEKKKNGKYKILLDDNQSIVTYEDVILKNNVLFKKELKEDIYNNIINDNKYEEAYIRCVKYIGIRFRSKYEIELYLQKYRYDDDIIKVTIDKLFKQKLLDENRFACAFTRDKFNFSTAGPYKIRHELKKQKINDEVIDNAISEISERDIESKLEKLIIKQLKTTKPKDLVLKNKIFVKMINLGYQKEFVLKVLNKYIV